MIFGYDAWGYKNGSIFKTKNSVHNINKMEITNAIFDELSIQESIIDKIYNVNKEEWQSDQILLAKFKNNLEAGNVENNGVPIEYLKIKKRKVEDFEWTNVAIVLYDKSKRLYQYLDKYICAGDEYEYAICPTSSNIDGKNVVSKIICEFKNMWIVDNNVDLKLQYNLDVGDYEYITQTTTFETLGGKYPIINCNPTLDYRKGNLKALLITDESINNYDEKIDIRKEKLYREKIMNFLRNNKVKLLKDGSGQFIALNVIGCPKLTPNNDLGQRIYEVNFEWVEVKDAYEFANKMFRENFGKNNIDII